jgi:predicted nuclease with TOPRIM domain
MTDNYEELQRSIRELRKEINQLRESYNQIRNDYHAINRQLDKLTSLIEGPNSSDAGEKMSLLSRMAELEQLEKANREQLAGQETAVKTVRRMINIALAAWPVILFLINYFMKK